MHRRLALRLCAPEHELTSTSVAVRRVGLVGPSTVAARLRGLLEREAFPVVVICVWTTMLAVSMPLLVLQDTFLALVDGRLIARHGLPHVDTLGYWTQGRPWVDQQWGAHLVLYELTEHGGLLAAVLVGILCVAGALAAAAVVGRKLGASSRSTAVGLLLPLAASWMMQVRTQSFGLVPFVVVYGLLALDARRPGRRVLLVLPLLVVWANLHGSVVLAAGLTALYGLTLLRRPGARRRATALLAGAPLCVLASPYGLDLIGYYHTMLVGSPLGQFIDEWQPPSVERATSLFFFSAFLLTALWSRHQRVLTSFERWAIGLLLIAALTAVRNAVWFELAMAVTFPRLLDAAWPSAIVLTPRVRRLNRVLASSALAVAAAVLAGQSSRPARWLEGAQPPAAAAAAVAAAAGSDGIVLADELHADWLLWHAPSLEGRVAYDIRFELFGRRELTRLRALGAGSRPVWRRCGATARVVVFATRRAERRVAQQDVLAPGTRPLRAAGVLTALVQPRSPGGCARL